MELIHGIIDVIILLGIITIVIMLRSYLPSYAKEKGKNLATREDISEITRKVEEVRTQHSAQLEHLKVDLGLLSKKNDILLAEKVRVFKELQKRLVMFKRYCEASYGDIAGGEFHPRSTDLPDDYNKSALVHLTAIHYLVEENFIFLSDHARAILSDFDSKMSLMCSMELAILDTNYDPLVMKGVPDAYESAIKRIDECLIDLFKDLHMPEFQ